MRLIIVFALNVGAISSFAQSLFSHQARRLTAHNEVSYHAAPALQRATGPQVLAAAAAGSLPLNESFYVGIPGNWRHESDALYTYTPAGKRSSYTLSTGGSIQSTETSLYNQNNHLTQRITNLRGSSSTFTATYTYNAQQQMLTANSYTGNPQNFTRRIWRFTYGNGYLDTVVETYQSNTSGSFEEARSRFILAHTQSGNVEGYKTQYFDNQPGARVWVTTADMHQMRLANNMTTFDPYSYFVLAEWEAEENVFFIGGRGIVQSSGTTYDSLRITGQHVAGRIKSKQEVKVDTTSWQVVQENLWLYTPQGHLAEKKATSYNQNTPHVFEWLIFTNSYDAADNRTEAVKELRENSTSIYSRSTYSNFITATRPKRLAGVTVYPNPSQGRFYVQGLMAETSYTLLTTNGVAVRQGKLGHGSSVAVEGLPPGLYRLQTPVGFAQVVVQ